MYIICIYKREVDVLDSIQYQPEILTFYNSYVYV